MKSDKASRHKIGIWRVDRAKIKFVWQTEVQSLTSRANRWWWRSWKLTVQIVRWRTAILRGSDRAKRTRWPRDVRLALMSYANCSGDERILGVIDEFLLPEDGRWLNWTGQSRSKIVCPDQNLKSELERIGIQAKAINQRWIDQSSRGWERKEQRQSKSQPEGNEQGSAGFIKKNATRMARSGRIKKRHRDWGKVQARRSGVMIVKIRGLFFIAAQFG